MSKFNFTEWTMRKYQLILVFVVALVLAGAYSLYTMPKEEFPDFDMPLAIMVGVYPGATTEQIEHELLDKMESYMYSFQDIDKHKMRSEVRDGMCIIYASVAENCSDADRVWKQVKQGLPLFKKTSLPAGVLAVELIDNFSSVPTLLLSIDSEDKSYRELEDYIERLRTELRGVDHISDLTKQGALHEQVSIYLDKERMVKYSVSRSMIEARLTMQGLTLGGAHASNQNTSIPIYVTQTYRTEREIADQPIYNDPSGRMIRLKDVARVVREYPDAQSYISINGRRALLLSVQMEKNQNITFFGQDVESVVENFKKTLPPSVHLNYLVNQPEVVNSSVVGFLRDLVEAIVIVLIVMMVLFPIRSAMVAGISIPFTIFFTLLGMNIFSLPLNTVTLASLIVVLGMIVDDGIIIIDAHQYELQQHHSSWYASVMSVQKLFSSISIATISICLVFVPFAILMPRMLHSFFFSFVMTIVIAMMCSLFTASVIVPIVNHWVLGKSTSGESAIKESRLLKPVEHGYEILLSLCFRYPWPTLGIGVGVVIAGALLLMHQPMKMVPSADRNQFIVEVHAPACTSIDKTAEISDSVASIMRRDPKVERVTEFVGQLMPRFMVTAPISMGSNSFSQMIVTTESSSATLELLRKYTGYFDKMWPGTYVRMLQLSYAPTGGLSVVFKGDNLALLHQAADSMENVMRHNPNLMWIHNSTGGTIPTAAIDIDDISAAQFGVSRMGIASDMAIRYGGFKVGDIWEGGYQMPVFLFTSQRDEQHDLSSIGDEYVSTVAGNVPLRQIAKIRPVWQDASIMHQNCQRAISVMADVRPGASEAKEVKAVKQFVNEHSDMFPEGVKIQMGGTANLNKLIGEPIAKSLIVSIAIILLIMFLNFQKIGLAILAMCGVVFVIPGAAVGQWLSGYDLGMTSTLGISSLLGIVMRNAIIMFDYAQEQIKNGMSVRDAAFEAGKRRMTPIFLTSATTAVGVVPIMMSDSMLWPPMGWIICFGTFFGTFLIVTIMPCAYWKLMDINKKGHRTVKASAAITGVLALLMMIPATAKAQVHLYSLDETLQLARENNLSLQKQRLDIESSKELKKSLYMHYFPTVNLNAAYMEMGGGLSMSETVKDIMWLILADAEKGELEDFNPRYAKRGVYGSLSFMEPVYTGGILTTINKLGKIGEEVSEAKTKMQENDVELEVEKYFWTLAQCYEAQKVIGVMDSLVERANHDASTALKAGLVTKNDVMEVDIYKSKLKGVKLKLQSGIDLCKTYLAHLTNQEHYDSIRWTMVTNVMKPEEYIVDHRSAVELRPETGLLDMQLQAYKLKKKLTRGYMLPKLAVGGAFNMHKFWSYQDQETWNNKIETKHTGWGFYGILTVPISSWWSKNHDLRRDDLKIQQAEIDRKEKRSLMSLQMDLKWKQMLNAYQQTVISQDQLDKAKQNETQQASAYRNGVITMTNRLQADALYEQSYIGYIDACVKYHIAVTEYLKATAR